MNANFFPATTAFALMILSEATYAAGVSEGLEVPIGPVFPGSIIRNPHPGCTTRLGDGQANCGLICANVPSAAKVILSDLDLFWNPNGGNVDPLHSMPYSPSAYGKDDSRPGSHRVESGFFRRALSDRFDRICMRVLNWSDATIRTFLLRIRYK